MGLDRLGRVSPSPWASRALAGHRRRNHPGTDSESDTPKRPDDRHSRPAQQPAPEPLAWPHTEPRRLHTSIALVATGAALVLTIAETARHHRPLEAALLGGTAAITTAVAVRLALTLGQIRRVAKWPRTGGATEARPH
jgi:hypothetical protein